MGHCPVHDMCAFTRFGRILSCEIIRDWKTGDSLQYAFIEFENRQACEDALFKMEGCLIDDRRYNETQS